MGIIYLLLLGRLWVRCDVYPCSHRMRLLVAGCVHVGREWMFCFTVFGGGEGVTSACSCLIGK